MSHPSYHRVEDIVPENPELQTSVQWQLAFEALDKTPTDILNVNPSDNRTILHYACSRKNRKDVDETVQKIFQRCREIPWESETIANFINLEDKKGVTALELACQKQNRPVVELLISNGANICNLRDCDHHAMQNMFDPFFVKLFDEAVTFEQHDHDVENNLLCNVNCNFRPLLGLNNFPNGTEDVLTSAVICQTEQLVFALRRKFVKDVIMQHPLVRIFLHWKLAKFSKLLYSIIIFRFIWSLISFAFIFCNTHILDSTKSDDPDRELNLTRYCQPFRIFQEDSVKLDVDTYFVLMIILCAISLICEIFKLMLTTDKFYYITQLRIIGQWCVLAALLAVWLVALLRQSGDYEKDLKNLGNLDPHKSFFWEYFLPALYIAGMFSALLLIQGQLTKIPCLGLYNEMFARAFENILKFLLTFLPVLFAFLVTFHILMPMRLEFRPEWGLGFAKILVMLTGEVGYDGVLYAADKDHIAFQNVLKVIFLIFAVTVVILLQNLLIGLTVSDVQKLEHRARIKYLVTQLEDIYLLETILLSGWALKTLKFLGCTDWYTNRLLIGASDMIRETKSGGKLKPKRLLEYPKDLRKQILRWRQEKQANPSEN